MRSSEDRDYFMKRAQQEENLAAQSADQTAAMVHASMAAVYRRRIHGIEQNLAMKPLRRRNLTQEAGRQSS
jgi:hypothetical protein